jgi:cell division protein ZapA (FtsZ GTPase activity inhibitor)
VAEKRRVPVRILGKEYRVLTDAEPEAVLQAAELLAETMERVRGRSGRADTLDVAVFAALNLANQVIALREGNASGLRPALDGVRLAELVALLESVVEPAPAAH